VVTASEKRSERGNKTTPGHDQMSMPWLKFVRCPSPDSDYELPVEVTRDWSAEIKLAVSDYIYLISRYCTPNLCGYFFESEGLF
jgi:hypothetical protein